MTNAATTQHYHRRVSRPADCCLPDWLDFPAHPQGTPDPDGSGAGLLIPAGPQIWYRLLPADRLALAGENKAWRRIATQFVHQIFVGPYIPKSHLTKSGGHPYLCRFFHLTGSCALSALGGQGGTEIGR